MNTDNRKHKTPEEVARDLQYRQILLNSAKIKCAPFEKKVRASMGEKYPIGMTPLDIANEIEANIEDGGYTVEMPNVNLSTANDIEGAIIEGNTDELMNILLRIAVQSEDPYIAGKSFEMYNQIDAYQQIEPAKIMAEAERKELDRIEKMELATELRGAIMEEAEELRAAIKEDKEELRDAIREEEERKLADKDEKEEKKPIIESPKKALKRAMGFDVDR